jgi:Fe-S-cluster containining protein
MKKVDIENLDKLPGVRIEDDDSFTFRCYPGIGCFNRCCRNLKFLDQYVDIVLRSKNYFPEVVLRISEDAEKTCPFLTQSGCSIYPDRPDTCRTFPVEQGVLFDADRKKDVPVYFFRPPDFCLGQHENTEWTISSWTGDQEAKQYHNMTIRWAEIKRMFQTDPWGLEGPQGSKAKMTFMAVYNVDRFQPKRHSSKS